MQHSSVLSATELFSLNDLILCFVTSTSIKKKTQIHNRMRVSALFF